MSSYVDWMGKSALTLGALAGSSLCVVPAAAQDTDTDTDTDSVAITRGEIIVTAGKRPQILKEVDATISVRTDDQLRDAGIGNVEDLENIVPGLVIDRRGNRNYSNFSLRGISSGDFYNPTLQVYVDGVPQDPAFFGQELFGTDKVEVLRGPQGTLYGRGAQSGVINITTRAPGDRLSVEVNGRYSTYDWNIGAGISGPLGNSGFAGSLEIRRADVTGQIDDFATGESNIDTSENWFGRARLKYAPEGSPFSAEITYVRDDIESSEELYLSEVNLEAMEFDSITQGGVNSFDRTVDSFAFKAQYDFGPAVLTSISSFQDRDISTRIIQGFDTPETQKTFSQEIRLAFDNGGKLSGVVGAFYEKVEFIRETPGVAFFGIGEARNQIERQTLAAFGEITYAITDTLDITGGLRWSYEDAEIDYESLAPSSLTIQDEVNFDNILPKIAIGWQFQPTQRLYAIASQGFKAGGFNNTIAFGEFDPTRDVQYEPETSDSLELGWRGKFADGRVEASVAGYWIKTDDKQAFLGPVGLQYLRNLGGAESYGMEVELKLIPSDNVSIDFGASFGKSEYTDAADPVNGVDFTGNRLAHAPDITAKATIDYRIPVTGLPDGVRLRLAGNYISETFFDDANIFAQQDYALLDASINLAFNDNVSIRLFGDNLTDRRYRTFSFASPAGTLSSVGIERTFGIELNARY